MAGRTLWGRGALIHSRYGIGRKKSRRPASTRQDGRRSAQAWYAHYSSPKCRHRQVVIGHRSAAKHGAPKLPAAAQQRCSQSPRRAAAARLSGGGWRSPEGVRARTVRSARRPGQNIPAACAFGRRCISTNQPRPVFQSKWEAWRKPTSGNRNALGCLQRVGALLQVFPCTTPAVVGARAPRLGWLNHQNPIALPPSAGRCRAFGARLLSEAHNDGCSSFLL